MNHDYEAILCIVNEGSSETAMQAAREVGAGGGTIIRALGTANSEAEKRYRITVQPEKEVILILAKKTMTDKILHALYHDVGLNTPGQGIAFSLPVDEVVGLSEHIQAEE